MECNFTTQSVVYFNIYVHFVKKMLANFSLIKINQRVSFLEFFAGVYTKHDNICHANK